jgi:beta-lactamase regulating signal transducer with metallopeptidase domain
MLETGLWLIVLIKFLVPFGPSWTFSLSSMYLQLFQSSSVYTIPSTDPTTFNVDKFYPVDVDTLDHSKPEAALTAPRQSPEIKDASPQWQWTTLIGMAYLLSVLSLLAFRVRSYHALVTHCHSLPGADGQTRNIVLNVCQRLGVRRIPSIRISDKYPTFVMGFFNPLLIISRHLLVRPDELETIIVHEVAHLRRGDMFVRYLEWIAGIFFFFWPVVAWINRRLDAAREYACDEWALRQGKLTAPEYARCLLRVVQPLRRPRFAYAPCSMATNPKTIERRIDMILHSKHCTSSRHIWSLLAFASLLAWAGFTLTGVAAGPNRVRYDHSRSATEKSVQKRVAAIYNLVREHDAADFNRDGVLSYLERDTYLVALAMRNAGSFMDEFPYADRNHSGNLDIIEAQDVIRAITLIAYADRRACAATEHVLPLEFCHAALDAQEWLLANSTSEPNPSELDPIWSVLCRIQGHPTSYSVRMFNHGNPNQSDKRRKYDRSSRRQFHELEGNIAAIKDRLASTNNPGRIVKLKLMLTKLETLLSKLQE